jgi:hypothetical protein
VEFTNRNLIVNGEFRNGLSSWEGTHVRHIENPTNKKDFALLLGSTITEKNPILFAILKQNVLLPLGQREVYRLYFRIFYPSPLNRPRLFATVVYLDNKRNILNLTPLLVLIRNTNWQWFSYFSICPPPPLRAHSASVVFFLENGAIILDSIQFKAHTG